ncbi:MAG: hypothetical protein ACYCWW_16180 [Deltaproteobacteria bacterium]
MRGPPASRGKDLVFPILLGLSGLFGLAVMCYIAAQGLSEWWSLLPAGLIGVLLIVEGVGLVYRTRWADTLSPWSALLAAILPPVGTATLIYAAFWHRPARD